MKKELFEQRLDCFLQKLHLVRTDIMPLITTCWPKAFANVTNNQKAIRERGWLPYTRNLLFHYLLRATITEDMMEWENTCGLFGEKMLKNLHDIEYVHSPNGVINMNCRKSDSVQHDIQSLNFNGGITAQYVSATILTESDRQQARHQSQLKKEEGTTLMERLGKINRSLTAGRMVLDVRQYGFKSNIRDHVRDIHNKKKEGDLIKRRRVELNYMKLCFKADQVLEKNKGKEVNSWKCKSDITTYLKPLKMKEDEKLPNERDALEDLFLLWNGRVRNMLSSDEHVLLSF